MKALTLVMGRRGSGDWGWGFIGFCLIVGGAYTLSPELFHGFAQWFINGVFDALGQFGGAPQSPVDGGPAPANPVEPPGGGGR